MYAVRTVYAGCQGRVRRLRTQHAELHKPIFPVEATWSTRSWLAMQTQRISVALHMACASEIARELRESATGAA